MLIVAGPVGNGEIQSGRERNEDQGFLEGGAPSYSEARSKGEGEVGHVQFPAEHG